MADDSGIDPRYAAQFQRGYDPQQHESASPPRDSGPVRLAGGPLPAAERVAAPPPLRAPVTPIVERSTTPRAPMRVEESEPVPWWRAAPTLEWALLAFGLLLVVASVALWWSGVAEAGASYQNPSVDEQFVLLLRSATPGAAFAAGLVAVSLWLLLRGMRARREAP